MSKKIVAVQDGLKNIAQELKELGCEVVDIAETDVALDAIIYSTKLSDQTLENDFSLTAGISAVDSDGLVMMLDADDFSVKEIVKKISDI